MGGWTGPSFDEVTHVCLFCPPDCDAERVRPAYYSKRCGGEKKSHCSSRCRSCLGRVAAAGRSSAVRRRTTDLPSFKAQVITRHSGAAIQQQQLTFTASDINDICDTEHHVVPLRLDAALIGAADVSCCTRLQNARSKANTAKH